MDRRPTSSDTKYRDGSFYTPGTQIRNTSATPIPEIWELAGFDSGLAQWVMLSGSSSGPTVQFTVPTAGPDTVVTPDSTGNVNYAAGTGLVISGNNATHTITYELVGGLAPIEEFTTDTSGPVVPLSGVVNVHGTGGITTDGSVANRLTITAGGTIATTYTTDNGTTATPSTQNLNIFTDAHYKALPVITGSGSTVTLNLSTALASPTPIGSTAASTAIFTAETIDNGAAADAALTYKQATVTKATTGYQNSSSSYKLSIGAFGTNDTIIADTNGGHYKGYLTSSLAPAGCIGEYMQGNRVRGSALALTDSTPADLFAATTLTPGLWMITVAVGFLGITTGTVITVGMNTTSATLPTDFAYDRISTSVMPNANADSFLCFNPIIKTVSSNTDWYTVVQANYTVGAAQAYGNVQFWRIG